MKRLISSADVRQAAAHGGKLVIDDNTIVTAQAKDEAAELHVELVHGTVEPACEKHDEAPHAEHAPEHVEHVEHAEHEPARAEEHHGDPAVSASFAVPSITASGASSSWRTFCTPRKRSR